MTKEGLERIKEAYYSGLKVQIWFCGHWENFDARDYSMYSDPFSDHRQYRIVGSAYADIAEKRIEVLEKENTELKAYNEKLLNGDIEKHNKIVELEKENTELKEKLAGSERTRDNLRHIGFPTFQSCNEYVDTLNYAKAIIEDLLDNSDEYARQRAEQFLGELDETIRV